MSNGLPFGLPFVFPKCQPYGLTKGQPKKRPVIKSAFYIYHFIMLARSFKPKSINGGSLIVW